jgi:hypothetical protein
LSIEAVSNVLQYSKATGRAKLVLLGIANHMGDQGSWPAISTLAGYANASERSVKRDIQELVELGELVVEVQAAPTNSQYKTNLYWITLDLPGVTTQVIRGDNSGKSGVTPVGTQTINRTIKEPINRGSRIPDNFEVTDAMREWAAKEVPGVDLIKQTANFVDYWKSKTGNATKLDWVATWRTWMRNQRAEPKRRDWIAERERENAERRARYEAEEQDD